MNEHFKLLGFKVRDAVTGFHGVVTTISFDLYGCVQAIVSPGKCDEKGDFGESRWFDTKRLIALSKKSVMEVPTFDVVPGGQELPGYPSKPLP